MTAGRRLCLLGGGAREDFVGELTEILEPLKQKLEPLKQKLESLQTEIVHMKEQAAQDIFLVLTKDKFYNDDFSKKLLFTPRHISDYPELKDYIYILQDLYIKIGDKIKHWIITRNNRSLFKTYSNAQQPFGKHAPP